MPRPNSSNLRLAIGLGLGIALFGAAPITFLFMGKIDGNNPLPASNSIRGAYINSQVCALWAEAGWGGAL